MDFKHSITFWFPNSPDFRHFFGQTVSGIQTFCLDFTHVMCLKTEHIKVQISDKFGLPTSGFHTFTVFFPPSKPFMSILSLSLHPFKVQCIAYTSVDSFSLHFLFGLKFSLKMCSKRMCSHSFGNFGRKRDSAKNVPLISRRKFYSNFCASKFW